MTDSSGGVGFRQGVVRTWDPLTARNTVEIGGTVFENLPILNTVEASLLQPGDVVGIEVTGRGVGSWYIKGRITIPGTPQATSAYSALFSRTRTITSTAIPNLWIGIQWTGTSNPSQLRSASALDATKDEVTLSDVLIGASGSCLIIISGELAANPASNSSSGVWDVGLTAAVIRQADGTIVSNGDAASILRYAGGWGTIAPVQILTQGGGQGAAVHTYRNLAPGLYSFQLRFRTFSSAAVQFDWTLPAITVIPL